jgi:hypothetical protein
VRDPREGRPLETGAPHGYPPVAFVAAARDGLFVDAARVNAAIGRRDNRYCERAGGRSSIAGWSPAATAEPAVCPAA